MLSAYGTFLRLPAWQVLTLVLTAAASLLVTCAVLIAIGALGADFNVTQARARRRLETWEPAQE